MFKDISTRYFDYPFCFHAQIPAFRIAPVNTSDEEGEPDAKKVKTKSAAKKVIKNPQAKLDDMRLCGQRGIPLLPKTFKNVTFKGKGWRCMLFSFRRRVYLLTIHNTILHVLSRLFQDTKCN